MIRYFYDLPLRLQRRGFYYGWVVLFAGSVGIIMSIPGQTMGVSVYTEALIQNLGLDREQLSLTYLWGTLCSSFLLPWAGRMIDKFGSRRVAMFASLALAIFLVFLASSPLASTGVSNLLGLSKPMGAMLVCFVGFLGIRHFGQGQLTMASRSMMGLWFEKRRGFVLGVSGLFVAFSFGIAPLFLNHLISELGWQKSLMSLAGMCFVMSVFAALIFRRSPEHCGLKLDGGVLKGHVLDPDEELPEEDSYTAAQAKRTFTFWAFNFGMVAQATLITAVTFHMSDIAKSFSMTSAHAFGVFLPLSIVSIASDFGAGYLSDKIPLRYLLAVMQLGMCVGLFGISIFGSPLGFAMVAGGFGLSSGIFALLNGASWPKLFGRAHLGAIAGAAMGWIVFGSAVGPYVFSLGGGGAAGYSKLALLAMLFPAAVFIASFFASPPNRKKARSAS